MGERKMQIEQLKEAATPEEMRAEICRLRRYDPMVQKVMDMADYRGLSAEDRYVILAYHALGERARSQQMVLDNAMTRPVHPLIVPFN
jgi:hypothetical protein